MIQSRRWNGKIYFKRIDNSEIPDSLYEFSYYYCAKGWRSGSSVFLKFQSYKVIKFKVKDNSKLESE